MAAPVEALIGLWNKQRQDLTDRNAVARQKEASFISGLNAMNNANKQYGSLADLRNRPLIQKELADAIQNSKTPEEEIRGILAVGAKYGGFGGLDRQVGYYVNALAKQTMTGNKSASLAQQKFDLDKASKEKKATKEEEMLYSSAEQTLSTIAEIEKGLKYFGAMGDLPPFPAEYSKKNWLANVNRLKDKLVVDLMLKLKSASPTGSTGFGQLSEKEGMRLENAATALQKGLKEEDAQRYLDEIKVGAEKILSSRETDGTEMPHPLGNKGKALNSLKSKYGLR